MRRTLIATAAVLALGLPWAARSTAAAADNPTVQADIIRLPDWHPDALYSAGWSADGFIDDVEVYGPNGDEIGDVENIVVGPDGRIRSVIAEVGGFWDIGDTHVNVPWNLVQWDRGAERLTIPVTEDSVEDYAVSLDGDEWMSVAEAGDSIQAVDDDVEVGRRGWLVSELIGDYARLSGGANYGYVDDVIFGSNGDVEAVVVRPDSGYGTAGHYAYPYYGYGYGFDPGLDYYQMPYAENDVADVEPFDYDAFE